MKIYHKVSTVVPFLRDCLLPIPEHMIGLRRRPRRGRGVRRFGAKETQPMSFCSEMVPAFYAYCIYSGVLQF